MTEAPPRDFLCRHPAACGDGVPAELTDSVKAVTKVSMDFLDLTLPTMAENIALDEALLDIAESASQPRELLRIWHPAEASVAIGRGSRVADEVHLDYCDRQGIPVLRRTSGGAAIVTGPGCLMYGVILSYAHRPQLRLIDTAHAFVLDQIAEPLSRIDPGVVRAGTSDLAIREASSPSSADSPNARKFSGNSMRRRRHHLLYHGTLLFDFPLEQIPQCLKTAPRQPEYREGRAHHDFVTCIRATAEELKAALLAAWSPDRQITKWPQTLVAQLVEQKYSRDEWNRRR